METNENVVAKPTHKKRNFKDALANVSKFISACRWVFMIVSMVEIILAFVYWTILFLTVAEVAALGPVVLVTLNIIHYFIPLATLTQIVLLIVLGMDAIETKTEIKMRIIFVFMSIASVLMTWSLVYDYWYKIISEALK